MRTCESKLKGRNTHPLSPSERGGMVGGERETSPATLSRCREHTGVDTSCRQLIPQREKINKVRKEGLLLISLLGSYLQSSDSRKHCFSPRTVRQGGERLGILLQKSSEEGFDPHTPRPNKHNRKGNSNYCIWLILWCKSDWKQ